MMFISNSAANMVSKVSQQSKFLAPTRINPMIIKVAELLMLLYNQHKSLLKSLFKTDLVENLLPVQEVEAEVEVCKIF